MLTALFVTTPTHYLEIKICAMKQIYLRFIPKECQPLKREQREKWYMKSTHGLIMGLWKKLEKRLVQYLYFYLGSDYNFFCTILHTKLKTDKIIESIF